MRELDLSLYRIDLAFLVIRFQGGLAAFCSPPTTPFCLLSVVGLLVLSVLVGASSSRTCLACVGRCLPLE